MKQTAVEWLIDILKGQQDKPFNFEEWMIAMEHAKEMEKEHIMEAHYWGVLNRNNHNSIPQSDILKDEIDRIGKQYYNETFKTE